jgi:plastocyanin
VDGLTAATLAEVSETERADGTSLWNIFANAQQDPAPQPGGGTGFLELLRFLPPSLQIGAGDTVKWTAFAPHTVTFPAAGQDPMTIDPFTAPATTNAVYDGSSLYNSSLLALGPGTPDTYELTFPTAGTFNYVCALHQFLGQTGTIVVLAAPAATPTPATTLPPTDTSGISSGAPSQGVPWLVIGLLTIFALSVATGTALLRRRR